MEVFVSIFENNSKSFLSHSNTTDSMVYELSVFLCGLIGEELRLGTWLHCYSTCSHKVDMGRIGE